MTNVRGLIRRGWMREGQMGLFYITEAGLEAVKTLPPAAPIDKTT